MFGSFGWLSKHHINVIYLISIGSPASCVMYHSHFSISINLCECEVFIILILVILFKIHHVVF